MLGLLEYWDGASPTTPVIVLSPRVSSPSEFDMQLWIAERLGDRVIAVSHAH